METKTLLKIMMITGFAVLLSGCDALMPFCDGSPIGLPWCPM